jgi:hypothetical protein
MPAFFALQRQRINKFCLKLLKFTGYLCSQKIKIAGRSQLSAMHIWSPVPVCTGAGAGETVLFQLLYRRISRGQAISVVSG